jgi:hypothetical protein
LGGAPWSLRLNCPAAILFAFFKYVLEVEAAFPIWLSVSENRLALLVAGAKPPMAST